MIKTIALFELRNGFRRVSTYIYFVLFFALGFLTFFVVAGAFPGVNVGLGAGGKLFANSAYMLYALISGTSYYGLLVVAAVMGNAAYQDFRYNTFALVFTSPISKTQYLIGRFLAANVLCLFIFSSIGIACFVASFMPAVDKGMIGPHHLLAYLQPYFLAVIPNTFFIGAVFFAVAALSRNLLAVYVSAVVLFVGYLIASVLSTQLDSKYFAGLIDPFGNFALEHVTQYWTVAEKNSLMIPMSGLVMVNRVIWTVGGVAVMAATCWRFRLTQGGEDRRRLRDSATDSRSIPDAPLPVAAVRTTSEIAFLPKLTWLEFKRIVASVPFLLIVACGVGFVIVSSTTMQSMFGTSVYPVTAVVSEIARGTFTLFMMIIIIVYSGQLVWRERELGMGQLFDAQPVSTWLPFVSKTAALILVQAFLLFVVMLTGVGMQTAQWYFNYEFGVYTMDLFGIQLINLALISVLAMLVQVLVNHKYVGHFVMVLYFVANVFTSNLGWDHHLYHYASGPGYKYSDMNGFGHFLYGLRWFQIYWMLFAILLAIVCKLFWVRGTETTFSARLHEAHRRLTKAAGAVILAICILLVVTGGFIFHNTNVLNDYQTNSTGRDRSAAYEKTYKSYQDLPQPRITAIKLDVDIHPSSRRIETKGVYELLNKTDQPIESVFINLPSQDIEIRELKFGDQDTPSTSDLDQGVYLFDLPKPLPPGGVTKLEFDLEFGSEGFKNNRGDTQIVYNGTFFNNGNMPHIGYMPGRELADND